MKKLSTIILIIVVLLTVATTVSAGKIATYEVTITNLTAGQPLTPPVIATHRRPVHIFQAGSAASFEVKEIAENGNSAPLLTALDGNKRVFDVQQSDMGPLVPAADPGGSGFADSVTFTVSGARGAKYLSFASMLVCTNDGFTGVDGLRLPKKVGHSVTVTTNGYDAGTELNTEDFADIVPPCQGLIGVSSDDAGSGMSNPALAEGGVIMHHAGIQGGDDLLPGVHGWADPVAMVEITRID